MSAPTQPTLFAAECERCARASAAASRTEPTTIANARRHLDEFWPLLDAVKTDTRHGPDLSPVGRLADAAGVLASYLSSALGLYQHLSEDMARLMIERAER